MVKHWSLSHFVSIVTMVLTYRLANYLDAGLPGGSCALSGSYIVVPRWTEH